MLVSAPPSSRGTVRQGGKEELRASVLKTSRLRVRSEKGERTVRQLLATAGIDSGAVDNETGWLSQLAAMRALRAIAELLGRDAVRYRGEWATHPEALGVLVRMLRASARPEDAYRYLAQNARETTRVGSWEIAQLAPRTRFRADQIEHVRMIYRPWPGMHETQRPEAHANTLLFQPPPSNLPSSPRIS